MAADIAAHYPNTYMEQLCKAVHSDLEMGKGCVAWFRQAIQHCTHILSHGPPSTVYFWTTVKNFIFPVRVTEMISQKVPISIHPRRLSQNDCQYLFFDIVNDYVHRAPRYAAESATNIMLWKLLYSLLGIMALGILFLCTLFAYYKFGETKSMTNVLEEVFRPQKRMQAIAARSLRLAKTELRNLKIKQAPRKENIIDCHDGINSLVLKVGTKYEFLESVVQGCVHSEGKFHRLYDQHNKPKAGLKVESLNKAMQFVDNNCHKLHLIIMFEENKYLEIEEHLKKSLSPPPVKYSPRLPTPTLKQVLNTRLEAGSTRQKQSTAANPGYNKPRPSTPKSHSTPRSTTTPRSISGIPRSVEQTSPKTRKSK